MSNFLQMTELENGNHSNVILNNQTMTLEFALLDGKIEKKSISTSLGLKVFFSVLLLILETLGNYLLFCMVWYEKFGMDSKKRTITNQLLTRMLLALILFNIFFMPLYFVGILIPLSEYFKELYDPEKLLLPYARHYSPAFCIFSTHFLKVKNDFLWSFFGKILALCMVSIQERVIMARVRYLIKLCNLHYIFKIICLNMLLL